MASNMVKVFISYGRADSRELAVRLRDDMLAVGFSVWLDLEEIPGGATWSVNIEEAIEHCDVTIALMSHASYSSQWCRAEQLRSLRKGKRVIPLLVQSDSEIPLILEHLNYLNFTDMMRYDEMFRDLLSDITAGQAFRLPNTQNMGDDSNSPFKKVRAKGTRTFNDEKRNAPAFRREISKLRKESWLGSRYWWPYFLFYFTDIHAVVDMLQNEEILSPHAAGGDFHSRWDKFVRLYFRPRTPGLFRSEGFRPMEQVKSDEYCPIPVYLLFDLEAVICQPETRFSEGDINHFKKTYKTPTNFGELPFEQIYHDSWFMPDERDEIMACRDAQVIIPDRMGLESLQFIWMRSPAEYETLKNLLSGDVWHKWRDKITARTDYQLFNRKWIYVEEAHLSNQELRFRFNPCDYKRDCEPFHIKVQVENQHGRAFSWENEAFVFDGKDLALQIPSQQSDYKVQMLIDGDVAYSGKYQPQMILL